MPVWGQGYSWIEFAGAVIAAFLGASGAIWAAWWQVRRQESLSVREMRQQMTVQSARELTAAMVALDRDLEAAWGRLGYPAGADAFDRYVAAITANRPMLHFVGFWELAVDLQNDANLFLRAWRYVEETLGESLHDPVSAGSAPSGGSTYESLRGLDRTRVVPPSKDPGRAWFRSAPIWAEGWLNAISSAVDRLSEQTIDAEMRVERQLEITLWNDWWKDAAERTAEAWRIAGVATTT